MKRLIIAFYSVLILCSPGWGAELLVMVQDGVNPLHNKKGDVVAVRPDGWKWGEKECAPLFKIIKWPNIPVGDVKYLEAHLVEIVDGEAVIVRDRKYKIPDVIMNSTDYDEKGIMTVKIQDIIAQKKSIIEKSLETEKAAVAVEKEAIDAKTSL